ncbi:MAG: crossover junction endodeoxyribonuclease RuvC [Deltaproteobacteria bacterium]|nr:crossover junction endodeoxyribonuclease RuvC [Deltaproteobacteria bacterium]
MGIRLGYDHGVRLCGGSQRVLGIDPGTVVTGWGVVAMEGSSLLHLAHGTIVSSRSCGQGSRLSRIYRGLQEVIKRYEPEGISLEKVFFARNAQSTLKLGQARGVALLAAAENNVAIHEYASAEVKLAVVGYGQATKEQVQKMVASLLHLSGRLPNDAADALAAAICQLHQGAFHARVMGALSGLGQEVHR